MGHARIGNVRLKVQPIRADVLVQDPQKTRFVDHIAKSYDTYVRDYGVAPDAIVAVLGGIKQTSRSCWTIQGESNAGRSALLALAHATLNRDLND